MTNNRFSAGGPGGASGLPAPGQVSPQVQPPQGFAFGRREPPGLAPPAVAVRAGPRAGPVVAMHQPVIASRNWAAFHPAGTRFRVFPMAGFGRDRTTRPIP